MNLHPIHSIFGRGRSLQRSDIDAYKAGDDPLMRNAIEQKAASDPFDADAMEGWEELGYDTTVMSRLDKKFLPKSGMGWYIGGATVLLLGVIAILVYTINPGNDPKKDALASVTEESPKEVELTLEESDVVLPEQIEEMVAAPVVKQFSPSSIKQDFQEIEAVRRKDPPIPVAELPLIELHTDRTRDMEIIRKHEFAREIYLHDFKLIDYRNYRSKPQIKTRQIILSGLPANFEDSLSENLDPSFREIEIPYIDYIDKSMRIFGQGNFKRALSRFEVVLESYAMDVNAHFYAGLCLFNLGEYGDALEHFDTCINGPYSNFDEEALWMQGMCYEHLNDRLKARKIFEKIVQEKGFYAEQAAKKIR